MTILMPLLFKLLPNNYCFTPSFNNTGKENISMYLIYCLAVAPSVTCLRFVFQTSAALRIFKFLENSWALFVYEQKTPCPVHSEIRFCAARTVKTD